MVNSPEISTVSLMLIADIDIPQKHSYGPFF